MANSVEHFYHGKNILITGGTGYFGKMLIEKLLRTTRVNNIYLIVRPKKDVGVEKRITKMFEEQIFCRITESVFLEKVHPIEGDLKKKFLGISKENREFLRENIHIVFHCGASLSMDSKLADAVMTNVNGTAEILEIMKKGKNLYAFILVSTAYSNCLNQIIEEKFYEPPIEPKLLIQIAQNMKSEMLNNISKGIIGKWPNTYSFTKAVSEHLLITEEFADMPVALFRPTIVTSTINDPIQGWTDNLYGPLGILLSSNCGILRVVRGNPHIKADTVPGDLVINGLLCYAWDVAIQWNNHHQSKLNYKAKVMNFSGNSSPLYLSIKEYTTLARTCGFTPFKKTIWKPMLYIVENEFFYKILKFLLHYAPAYFFDFLLIISGRKPRMRKIYQKLDKVMDVLHYFLIHEWAIKNENVKVLWEKLSPNDRITYNFNFTTITAETYLRNLMDGLKKYTLKEDMSKIQYHKARYERIIIFHNILKYVCLVFLGHSFIKRLIYFLKNLYNNT